MKTREGGQTTDEEGICGLLEIPLFPHSSNPFPILSITASRHSLFRRGKLRPEEENLSLSSPEKLPCSSDGHSSSSAASGSGGLLLLYSGGLRRGQQHPSPTILFSGTPYFSQIKHSSVATHQEPCCTNPYYTPLLQNPPRALR